MRVLIIGAGVTGLFVAHGLEKAGIDYTVFEAEEESAFRPREWTMAIHWASPLIKELLPESLMARLHEAYVDPSLDYDQYPYNGTRIYNADTGEMIMEMKVEGRLVRVSRRRLRFLCSEGVAVEVSVKVQCEWVRSDIWRSMAMPSSIFPLHATAR